MYWILYRIKPSVGMFVLDKVHRHDVDFHYFITFLISSKFLRCFISRGKLCQIFGLRNFMLSVQLKILCTYSIRKFVCFLNWQGNASLNWKIFFPNFRTYDFKHFKHFNCWKADILMVNRDRKIYFKKFFKIWYFLVVHSETDLGLLQYPRWSTLWK